MIKTYLFTGATGQLGQALIRKLSGDKDNLIIGLCGDIESESAKKIVALGCDNVILVPYPRAQEGLFKPLLCSHKPAVIGHLSAQSSVFDASLDPLGCFKTNVAKTVEILSAVKDSCTTEYQPKFFNMSSVEIFGGQIRFINENSPICPVNQYGISKAAAHMYVDSYRNHYGVWASNIITSNFISELQSTKFVAAKIFNYIKLLNAQSNKLELGNINSTRDWMYVDDLVEAILLILSQKNADNYCVSSGNVLSVAQLVKLSFKKIGIDNYLDFIRVDNQLLRRVDTNFANIDLSKIKSIGWEPKYNIDELLNKILIEK